jgi:hypothetical protein
LCSKILKREPQLPGLATEEDFDNDRRVQRDVHVGGSHGGQGRRLTVVEVGKRWKRVAMQTRCDAVLREESSWQ